MSEELENKEVKNAEKKTTTRKRTTAKATQKTEPKEEIITAEYKYKPEEGEKLITDKPSTPLQKVVKNEVKKMQKPSTPPKTNGQIYEAYIKELKDFKLVYNGDVIYDSTLSKGDNTNLSFESDYFVLFGKKYSYNGLRVQKI